MKVVILAGGYGTRISEESMVKPKPMIEIGGQPILWHIMKEYSYYGYHEFIICAGYKQHVIKEYFANYYLYRSDITFDFTKENAVLIHHNAAEPWKVTVVDTGLHTLTGGRIQKIQDYINNESFLITYGDAVCDVNIQDVVSFHKKHGKVITMTAVQPEGRFGTLQIGEHHIVDTFSEKKKEDSGWINGGYMVAEPKLFDYISGEQVALEREPLRKLSGEKQLAAYKHRGFWKCMDTLKEKNQLDEMIQCGHAPWMVWGGYRRWQIGKMSKKQGRRSKALLQPTIMILRRKKNYIKQVIGLHMRRVCMMKKKCVYWQMQCLIFG